MKTIDQAVEVEVPVRTAYNQWTQFEEFPRFMEGVESVKQLDDTTLEWTVEIAGQERRWKADITEQEPDQRISWKSTGDIQNSGVVTFHKIDDERTRVMLQFGFEPEGFTDHVADALGVLERRIEGDMGRFKQFIESRGTETGAWRGEVEQDPTS